MLFQVCLLTMLFYCITCCSLGYYSLSVKHSQVKSLKRIILIFTLQSCPFLLEVFSNKCRPTLQVNSILENRNEVVEKAVVTSVLNNISRKENVRGMRDLILYKYESTIRVTLVLQNLVRQLWLQLYMVYLSKGVMRTCNIQPIFLCCTKLLLQIYRFKGNQKISKDQLNMVEEHQRDHYLNPMVSLLLVPLPWPCHLPPFSGWEEE